MFTHSTRRNGTTYMCPAFSTSEFPLSPLATRPPVKVSIWSVLTIFTEVAADSLRGRVFDISLGELQTEAHDSAWRKVKVQVEEIKGFDCYTNFHGLDVTRDKLCSLVKKWHSLIEAFVQAKTVDGYLVRIFAIAFTRRHKHQVKATCYTKTSHQKQLRQKMMEILVAECAKSSLKDLFKKLITDQVAKQITKDCSKIFPLENVLIRKVKVLKKPKFDLTKLMELY